MSTATVSHVLNDSQFVSGELRERVLAAVRELNYQPNTVARSLRTQATHTVGLIVSDIELPFFSSVARGVQDSLARHGRTVILCNTDEDPRQEKEALEVLWGKRVDGLIIAPTGSNGDLIRKMQASGTRIVLVDRRCPGVEAPFVGVDDRLAAHEATHYLVARGHRRIGLVAGLAHVSTIVGRVQGYLDAMAEAGVAPLGDLIRYTDSRTPGGREAARALLRLDPPVTAIFATVSSLTLGVLEAFRENGIQCPHDVSLVGFDDPEWTAVSSPPVTVVHHPAYDIGTAAGDLLAEWIVRGEIARGREVLLAAPLIERDSVASPRVQCAPGDGARSDV